MSGVYFMRDRSRAKTAANGWAAGIPGRRGPERVCPEPQRHQSQTVPLIRTRWRRFQDPCPGCSFRPPPDRSRAKTAANGWAAGIPGRRGPDTAVSSTAGQAPVTQAFSSLSFWASTLLAFASRKPSCAWVVASSAFCLTRVRAAAAGSSDTPWLDRRRSACTALYSTERFSFCPRYSPRVTNCLT